MGIAHILVSVVFTSTMADDDNDDSNDDDYKSTDSDTDTDCNSWKCRWWR